MRGFNMEDERTGGKDRETEILEIVHKLFGKVAEIDNIVVVAQYKDNRGFIWYGPDSAHVAEMNWMLDTLKAYLLSSIVPSDPH